MKKFLAIMLAGGTLLLPGCCTTHHDNSTVKREHHLTPLNRAIVDAQEQRYVTSTVPMSIELVLKLLGRLPASDYELQSPWENKTDGSFGDFDGKTINGITFHQRFTMERNNQFPLDQLFAAIDKEVKAGRFVIVSLASNEGWHMYVIYDEVADGDFEAISKDGATTIEAKHVKKTITQMRGTDIMTYSM